MEIQLYRQGASCLKLIINLTFQFYFFRPAETQKKSSIFEHLIGKVNTPFVSSNVETSRFFNNIFPIENKLFHKPLLVDFSQVHSLQVHKYDVRYDRVACTPVTNFKFIIDFKSLKVTVLYGKVYFSWFSFILYKDLISKNSDSGTSDILLIVTM